MEKLILAGYSSLTITCLMVSILGLSVLYKCHKDKDYGDVFLVSLAISMGAMGQFFMRGWWTLWKDRYISREPSAWMMDHPIVFFCTVLMVASGILFIKALTQESPYGRLWKLCLTVILCVGLMAYLKR